MSSFNVNKLEWSLTGNSRHQFQGPQDPYSSQCWKVQTTLFAMNLLLRLGHQHGQKPWDHHDEIHDVPGVPEIGVRVEDETHGDNLGAHLHCEDSHEVRLEFLLNIIIHFNQVLFLCECYQLKCKNCFVSIRKVSVHGHDHTVGHDGQDDAVLERSAVDKPLHQSSKMCQSIEK